MTVAPLADTDARDRLRTELNTTFFVEAGAGTGKTTALVTRIVELIAAGALQMERLAAITFTEAAAAELRDRIRQDLDARCASSKPTHVSGSCASRLPNQVDLASIQTIHAFAGALLRTYPLEADLPPNFTMLDEIQQERAFDDRFRALAVRRGARAGVSRASFGRAPRTGAGHVAGAAARAGDPPAGLSRPARRWNHLARSITRGSD